MRLFRYYLSSHHVVKSGHLEWLENAYCVTPPDEFDRCGGGGTNSHQQMKFRLSHIFTNFESTVP